MAEVVGLVSAIVTLAELGLKLAKGISTVAEELGTAGAQLKAIATDTKAVALILHELKRHLKTTKNITKRALEVAHEIVAQCHVDVEDLDRCMAPLFSRGDGDEFGMMKRVKWLFAKSKLATRRAALDSLKLTLNLYICGLGFMDGDNLEEYMQDEFKHMVSQCKSTKTVFLEAERYDQTTEKAYDAYQTARGDLELEGGGEDSVASTANAGPKSDDETAVVMASPEQRGRPCSENQHIQLYYSQASDFAVIETLSDDQFIKIGEHIRIQRIASNFALMTLNQGQATPEEPTQQPAFQPARRPVPHTGSFSSAPNQSDVDPVNGSARASPSSVSATYTQAEDDSQSWASSSSSESVEDQQGRASPPHITVPSGARGDSRHSGRSRQSVPPRSAGVGSTPDEFQPFASDYPQSHHIPNSNYTYQRSHPSNYFDQSQRGYGYHFVPSQHTTPPMTQDDSTRTPKPPPDPEKIRLEAEIAAFKTMQERQKANEKQKEIEALIRREAEAAFQQRMEEMGRAQEEAKKEIERARAEAERAAFEKFRAEDKVEEERKRLQEKAMKEIEQQVREEFEARMAAEKKSKGLRKYIFGS